MVKTARRCSVAARNNDLLAIASASFQRHAKNLYLNTGGIGSSNVLRPKDDLDLPLVDYDPFDMTADQVSCGLIMMAVEAVRGKISI